MTVEGEQCYTSVCAPLPEQLHAPLPRCCTDTCHSRHLSSSAECVARRFVFHLPALYHTEHRLVGSKASDYRVLDESFAEDEE